MTGDFEKKYLCVISHTHWDREWYMPLDIMRLRLVDLIDNCLKLLENDKNYIFHLDAQTIVLEDYLSIRTSKAATLKKFITEGRLIVGPWYVQNDFFLTSGEATVRNLFEGIRIAESFGKCAKVGYCPDQFGIISQLPQIFEGFGIDNIIFGRGAARYEKDENGKPVRIPFPSEFLWSGADGSTVTAIHLSHWYNNAQRFSSDIEKAEKMVKKIEESFEKISVTPYLLLMNGVDHLEAQEDLLPILNTLNTRSGDNRSIFQTTMTDYAAAVKSYIASNNIELYKHCGELRGGSDGEILKGTLSSRIYLKQHNVQMQEMLEGCLEPLYSMLERNGMTEVYSLEHFRYMWKELIKNHPHDSICGCSRDEVHAHMEDTFARLREMSGDMLQRGMALAAEYIPHSSEGYGIITANTTQSVKSGPVRVTVDIPIEDDYPGIAITDSLGKPAEFTVRSKKETKRDTFSPINLPGVIDVYRYEVDLFVKELLPFSFRNYKVFKSEIQNEIYSSESRDPIIENEFLSVTAAEDGTVTIVDKLTGRIISNAVIWEESADIGDSYIYMADRNCDTFYSTSTHADTESYSINPFEQTIKISRKFILPLDYDFKKNKRSDNMVECSAELSLTLKTGIPELFIDYSVENKVKNHRLRLLINTGITSDESLSDSPFDVLHRSDSAHYEGTGSRVYPNSSFCAVADKDFGTAVFTCGQHEYEHINRKSGDLLALTVVRGTGVINSIINGKCGGQWDCPGNQCIRKIEGKLSLYCYAKNNESKLSISAKANRCDIIPYFYACDRRKFSGGRPAVQDTDIAEIFYKPLQYRNISLKCDRPEIEFTGDGVLITAFKKSEDGHGHILRLVNLNSEPVSSSLNINGKIIKCRIDESEIEILGEDHEELNLRGKEIVTLRIIR